jgi:fermentation-respiration switch protein FrsA (DUF1100 family)
MYLSSALLGLFALVLFNSCTHFLFFPSPALVVSPEQLGLEYEDVYFRSADGTRLHGWFFPTRTQPLKGIVVQFHGNAENLSTHFRSLIWVIEHGYHLFTFDYRGYGRSEGQVSVEGAVDDVRAAIAQARMLPMLEAGTRLVLYGQSLGGTLLLYVAGTMKDRDGIALVIADSSFDSYQAIAREKLAGNWLTFILQPLACVLLSDRYAPEHVLAKISPVPLLVIHGDRDQIVPVHYGQRIYDRAKAPKWFWKLEGVGHIQAMAPRYDQYRQALLDFLDQLASVSE